MNNQDIKTHDEIETPWYWGEHFYDGEDYFNTVNFADTEHYLQQNIDKAHELTAQLTPMNNQRFIDYVLKYGRDDKMNLDHHFDAYHIAEKIKNNQYQMTVKQKSAILNVYVFSKTSFNPKCIPTLDQYLYWLSQQPKTDIQGTMFTGF